MLNFRCWKWTLNNIWSPWWKPYILWTHYNSIFFHHSLTFNSLAHWWKHFFHFLGDLIEEAVTFSLFYFFDFIFIGNYYWSMIISSKRFISKQIFIVTLNLALNSLHLHVFFVMCDVWMCHCLFVQSLCSNRQAWIRS